MVKRLIFCNLINCFFLVSILAQDVKTLQDDSLIYQGSHNFFTDSVNHKAEKRLNGYAGMATASGQMAYYGGFTYALKDNMSLRFDLIYGTGNSLLFGPLMNNNTRIVAPSMLYEYTIIGKSVNHSPFNFNTGSAGLSVYTFAGIGAQMSNANNSIITNEGGLLAPNVKTFNLSIPVGVGMQYKFDNSMAIGLEIRGNFRISNNGYYNPYIDGINSYHNSLGQWGYPGVMLRQFRNGPGF